VCHILLLESNASVIRLNIWDLRPQFTFEWNIRDCTCDSLQVLSSRRIVPFWIPLYASLSLANGSLLDPAAIFLWSISNGLFSSFQTFPLHLFLHCFAPVGFSESQWIIPTRHAYFWDIYYFPAIVQQCNSRYSLNNCHLFSLHDISRLRWAMQSVLGFETLNIKLPCESSYLICIWRESWNAPWIKNGAFAIAWG
jgi:hypothetical protein